MTNKQQKKTPIGIFDDITLDDYHTMGGVSRSGVNLLLHCPKLFWNTYINPKRTPQKATPAQTLGTLFHKLMLEPKQFFYDYHHEPGVIHDARKKAYKDAKQKAQALGKELVTDDQLDILMQMATSLRHLPHAEKLLCDGYAEHSLCWNDPDTGVLCKSRPDYFTDNYIIDLKTTDNAHPFSFSKKIYDLGYHRQAAMALDGLSALTNNTYDAFILFVVETKPPYLAIAYLLDDAAIERGRQDYKKALTIYQYSMDTNDWPGYSNQLTDISIPTWALEQAA